MPTSALACLGSPATKMPESLGPSVRRSSSELAWRCGTKLTEKKRARQYSAPKRWNPGRWTVPSSPANQRGADRAAAARSCLRRGTRLQAARHPGQARRRRRRGEARGSRARRPLSGGRDRPQSRRSKRNGADSPLERRAHVVVQKKTKAQELILGSQIIPRRRPTLPRGLPRSTIGAEGLNCRVRNGNGCGPFAKITGKTNYSFPYYQESRQLKFRRFAA